MADLSLPTPVYRRPPCSHWSTSGSIMEGEEAKMLNEDANEDMELAGRRGTDARSRHEGGDPGAHVRLDELDIPPELPGEDEDPQGEPCGAAMEGAPALPPGLAELTHDLGLDAVVREQVGSLVWWSDRRGAPWTNERLLRKLHPVVRQLARGRTGLVGAVGRDDGAKHMAVAVGSALTMALLEESDGVGEVLLADRIIGSHQLDVAVVEQLRTGVREGWPARRMDHLNRLHAVLDRAVTSGLNCIARYRALSRADHGSLDVGVRVVSGQEQVIDGQHAAH